MFSSHDDLLDVVCLVGVLVLNKVSLTDITVPTLWDEMSLITLLTPFVTLFGCQSFPHPKPCKKVGMTFTPVYQRNTRDSETLRLKG